MQISDAVIRGSRNLTKKTDQKKTKTKNQTRKQPKKDKTQKTDQKTALFRANKHLEKFYHIKLS